jgi:hypothetical protein
MQGITSSGGWFHSVFGGSHFSPVPKKCSGNFHSEHHRRKRESRIGLNRAAKTGRPLRFTAGVNDCVLDEFLDPRKADPGGVFLECLFGRGWHGGQQTTATPHRQHTNARGQSNRSRIDDTAGDLLT